jgi:methyltransferase-like protein
LIKISADIIEMEQYMDFLRNRTLRQTLLCHDRVAVQRSLRPGPEWMSTFYVATYAYPISSEINIHDDSVAQFRGPDGATLSIDHPVSKAALLYLAQVSPQALPLSQLYHFAHHQVNGESAPPAEAWGRDAQALMANILKAYSYSMRLVELHLHAARFVLEAGRLPLASALARLQASRGAQKVSNLRHERVKLDHTSQLLLPYLDGSHDRPALLKMLVGQVRQGQINLEHEGRPVRDPAKIRQILDQEMELALRWLGRAALLEG